MKLEIERDGQRREITGWRKWAIAILVIVIAALAVAAAVLFVVGLTFTVGAILVVALPVAVVGAFLWQFLANPRSRG